MKHLMSAIVLLLLVPCGVHAQMNSQPAIPVQITSAHTIFLSNAGEEEKANSERVYKRLWTILSQSAQPRLTASPANADLIVETHYLKRPDLSGTSETGVTRYVYFIRMDIIDRPTHVILWSVTEYLDLLANQFHFDAALEAATDGLAADLKTLAMGKFPAALTSQDKR